MGIAISLAEGHALELGEVLEPSNAQSANRLIAGIDDHMGGLIVVAVEVLLRFDAVLLHETDTADSIGMQQLLVCGHDFAADLIVVRRDGPHLMFHKLSPRYVR